MKGIILAGGLGTRLHPLTITTNKHLLPVYDKPMCFYPIETLIKAGIDEIMLVTSGLHAGDFLPLLGNGERFNLKRLVYGYQEKPDGGIADALSVAAKFAEQEPVAVILGDNTTDADISVQVAKFKEATRVVKHKAHIFLKGVPDPERFGIVDINKTGEIVSITEKPQFPKSNLAVTGLYLYDNSVFDFINNCSISKRGELEITDVNNMYLAAGNLSWSLLPGYWRDAGTFDTLFEASKYWAEKHY
jgi:glucose-1-phosphate thymidylyltransferase